MHARPQHGPEVVPSAMPAKIAGDEPCALVDGQGPDLPPPERPRVALVLQPVQQVACSINLIAVIDNDESAILIARGVSQAITIGHENMKFAPAAEARVRSRGRHWGRSRPPREGDRRGPSLSALRFTKNSWGRLKACRDCGCHL